MADMRTSEASEREAWIRGHVFTRFFATVWWVLVLSVTVGTVATYLDAARHPGWPSILGAAIVTLIFIPIGREWPNWRRMGRMLVHGT